MRWSTIAAHMIHQRRWRHLAGLILRRLGGAPYLVFRWSDVHLRLFNSSLAVALWIEPDARPDDRAFYASYLRPGDWVVDGGANIGSLTLLASRLVGIHGRVIAFEPHPRIYRWLRHNRRLNDAENVDTYQLALSDQTGILWLTDLREDDCNHITRRDNRKTIIINSTRLDDKVAPSPIALFKLDIEGAELAALKGAPHTLARTACVYIEISPNALQGAGISPASVISSLKEAGFTVYRRVSQMTPPCLIVIDTEIPFTVTENIFAIRDINAFRERTGWQIESGEMI